MSNDRERVDKLAERLSGELYASGRIGSFEYANSTTEHMLQQHHREQQREREQQHQHHQQNSIGAGGPGGQSAGGGNGGASVGHPATPDLSPAPASAAIWNSKINKAGTVTTPDGE